MICDCEAGGYLSVKQTYANGSCKTQRAVCISCGKVFTLVTISMGAKNGRGAFAMAKAIEAHKVEVIVKERADGG